jgi:P22 coat protein - gene protein 5
MALANTLTGLIPTLYAARDIVSRELVGLIPAVTVDANASRGSKDQIVRVHITPKLVAVDITPAMTPPTPDSVAQSFVDMSVTKMRAVQIPWSGEETQSITENGPGIDNVLRDQLAQGMRTLTNEIESDLAGLYVNASRSIAPAGGAPFTPAQGLVDSAKVRQVLDDNGAPLFDRHLVINTAAGVNLRTQTQLTKANEAGTDFTLRRGELLDLHGFSIRESAQIKSPTSGTGSAYTTNTAGYAVGATSITLITGSGTILAGDRITIGSDPNIYVVKTGIAAPGAIVLNDPGLRVAIPASATAVTVQTSRALNMAFVRSSMILLARAPYLPGGQDMARDRMTITDPVSGLPFEVATYQGYHAHFIEISMSWGVKGIKPEHAALLQGS